MTSASSVLWFADIDTRDKKNAGHEVKKLSDLFQAGFPIPPGFIISTDAYVRFLKEHKLDHRIKALLSTVNFERPESIMQVTDHIKRMFYHAAFSPALIEELQGFYNKLGTKGVTIRSYSNTKDFSKNISQQAHSLDEFLLKVKEGWANHFAAGLIAHRHEHGLDHIETGSVIIVQRIPHPEKHGKVFTIDLLTHNKSNIIIMHALENGIDTYSLTKKTLFIVGRELKHHDLTTPKLSHDELLQIGKMARALEAHHYFPLEISWGFENNKIVILSIKHSTASPGIKPVVKAKLPISRGISITPTIATGLTKIIEHTKDLNSIKKEDIVIIGTVLPKDIKKLKHAKGILAEHGSKHSESAAMIQKLGIPTIFNVKDALKKFKHASLVTIHAGKGEVYKGGLQ